MKCAFRWLLVLALATVGVARADLIPILSEGTAVDPLEWNNCGAVGGLVGCVGGPPNPNVPIVPVGAWQAPFGGASWISYAPTGAGGIAPPNGAFVTFTQWFLLPYDQNTGGAWIWADDTTTVSLDGALLMGWSVGPPGPACDGVIGCAPGSGWFLNLTGIGGGWHQLQFDVRQNWGDGYGLLYTGSVESVP